MSALKIEEWDDGTFDESGCLELHLTLKDGDKVAGELKAISFDRVFFQLSWSSILFDADSQCPCIPMLNTAKRYGLASGNISVLSSMKIEPQYRRAGHGIRMIKHAIEHTRMEMEKPVFLLHPCPFYWNTKSERIAGMEKLVAYYSKHLPIHRIGKSDYFFIEREAKINP